MGERQSARTMVQILQDQVDNIQEELHKTEEVLAMLVGVVKTIHHQHDKPVVVESGPLEVDLEDTGQTTVWDHMDPMTPAPKWVDIRDEVTYHGAAEELPAPFTGTPYDANTEED